MELAQIIFLLGGHDLEMAEIRRIIEARGIQLYDNNLEWNCINKYAYEIYIESKPYKTNKYEYSHSFRHHVYPAICLWLE